MYVFSTVSGRLRCLSSGFLLLSNTRNRQMFEIGVSEGGKLPSEVSAGPFFSGSIEMSAGEVVERDVFFYADPFPG
jgi:hypothetical protein